MEWNFYETTRALEKGMMGRPRECFQNAQRVYGKAKWKHLGLKYVEGIAYTTVGGVTEAVHHGWLVDRLGRVLEPTAYDVPCHMVNYLGAIVEPMDWNSIPEGAFVDQWSVFTTEEVYAATEHLLVPVIGEEAFVKAKQKDLLLDKNEWALL